MDDAGLTQLAAELKKKCGCGGIYLSIGLQK
jgi:translation initiation factor 1 (eIF-1/SUI1)